MLDLLSGSASGNGSHTLEYPLRFLRANHVRHGHFGFVSPYEDKLSMYDRLTIKAALTRCYGVHAHWDALETELSGHHLRQMSCGGFAAVVTKLWKSYNMTSSRVGSAYMLLRDLYDAAYAGYVDNAGSVSWNVVAPSR